MLVFYANTVEKWKQRGREGSRMTMTIMAMADVPLPLGVWGGLAVGRN
jgi:hypothetical protein